MNKIYESRAEALLSIDEMIGHLFDELEAQVCCLVVDVTEAQVCCLMVDVILRHGSVVWW